MVNPLTLTDSTNLNLILAMAMVPASKAPVIPGKSPKRLSQISSRTDNLSMEQVRNGDLFAKARSLINDLIFDPWKAGKAVELRTIFSTMDTVAEVSDDLDNVINVIMERIERLASLRLRADNAEKNGNPIAAEKLEKLAQGHEKLISFIESCFRI